MTLSLSRRVAICALLAAASYPAFTPMATGRAMATEYFLPLQIYCAVGLCYFLVAWPFSLLSRRLAVR